MIFEIGSNLYYLLLFLIVAWAITRFLIAVTKIPTVPRERGAKEQKDDPAPIKYT